jgi:hypothetical protein
MGASPSLNSGPPKRPYYLTGDEDVWKSFPAKPAVGSAIDQADLLITLSVQTSRNEDQKNEALRDRKYSIKLVTDVIDPDFDTKYPDVFQVLANATRSISPTVLKPLLGCAHETLNKAGKDRKSPVSPASGDETEV